MLRSVKIEALKTQSIRGKPGAPCGIRTHGPRIYRALPRPGHRGRERGLVLHKLMEEVLTGEIADDVAKLQSRPSELLTQLGLHDAEDAATGPCSHEMAAAAQRTLQLPEIAELRPKLLPEFPVYASAVVDQTASLTACIADAVAIEAGWIETVIDWNSDVNPTAADIEMYRGQVRDYLTATGAGLGLIVFVTSGRIERVQSAH